jgi:hypothetical protein
MRANTSPTCFATVGGGYVSPEFQCGACNATLERVPWRLKVANGIIAVVLATFTVLSLLSWLLVSRLRVKVMVS